MARKSTMVTSIDEIVGWNKMADGRILSNEEFDGENGHRLFVSGNRIFFPSIT